MSTPPTVLLADDSLTIQRVVSLTFADQPVRVVVAKDGQDAINRMIRERPDVVLADTNMPCVDGYELARWVREQPHLSTVPVLLLAGVADPVDEQRLHDSGANGVLEKPFEPSHVISRVKELLGLKGAPPAVAGRLVTAPDITPTTAPALKPSAEARQTGTAAAEPAGGASAQEAAVPPGGPATIHAQEASAAPAAPSAAPPSEERAGHETSIGTSELFDVAVPPGDARDWFGDDTPPPPSDRSAASLVEEFGRFGNMFPAPVEESAGVSEADAGGESGARSAPRPRSLSSADVFESLLAAEQGHAAPPVMVPAGAELTPAMLDDLATRIVSRLRPELQSLGGEVRAAVAEAVRAAVPPAIEQHLAAGVEHAIAVSMTDLVREAVARQVHDVVVPSIRDTVRDVVDVAARSVLAEAVAAAVPAAVLEAVRGEGPGGVSALVRETAERLITEEIARIRRPRP